MKFAISLLLPTLASAWVAPTQVSGVSAFTNKRSFSANPICMARGGDELNTNPSEEFGLPTFDLPLEFTMRVSDIVYSFSALRDIVGDHEAKYNKDLSDKEKKKAELVSFDKPGLIDTRNFDENLFPAAKMRHPVTAANIKEFLDRNKGYIKHEFLTDPEFIYKNDNTEDNWLAQVMGDFGDNFDADIIEFDDKFDCDGLDTQLVYSVIVNRSSKQVIVVFRGTVNAKDGIVDAQFKYDQPDILKKITERDVKLHKGFSKYLTGETPEGKTQLEQVIAVLKDVYAYKDDDGRDYSNYKLVITGHSLGGSLAQLCSYFMGGLEEMDFVPKPVLAVTYASPVVGNHAFYKTYRDLEKANKLRHIRVSNQNDVVPGCPGGGVFKPYVQTGVNIHLQPKKKAEVEYENTKSIVSQASLDPLGHHKLYSDTGTSYYERLYGKDKNGKYINSDLLDKTIEQLYDEYARLE